MKRAPERTASARVGRVGPGSLSFRLLIVLLVPIVAMLSIDFREVQRQSGAVEAAGKTRELTQLLAATGEVIVPWYLEYSATSGVIQAETEVGAAFNRNDLLKITNTDFLFILRKSRADVDKGFAVVQREAADVDPVLAKLVNDTIDTVGGQLSSVRLDFDHKAPHYEQLPTTYAHLTDLLMKMTIGIQESLGAAATTDDLVPLVAEADQVVAGLQYGSEELMHLTDAGVSGNPDFHIPKMVRAGGSLDASLVELRLLIDPARRPRLDELVNGEKFARVQSLTDEYTRVVTAAAHNPDETAPRLVTSPADVKVLSTTVVASYQRLDALRQYAVDFLAAETARADHVQADASNARRTAVVVMVLTLVLSLALLALVMRSVLRPLRRLVRQSQLVREGDLSAELEKPSGPTDVRVVMRAFNDMVITLKAYESQLSRLAQGDTKVDASLPGPLGDTVRRSVSHLATVTAQLHESEAAAVRQARTDALTGLANRTAALERLAIIAFDARQRGVPGAIIFLDLDGFKSVNDTQGHAEGDRILSEIGQRLRVECPFELVARIGGDEFVILLEAAPSLEGVIARARHLIDVVSAPCLGSGGQMFALSASAGVSMVDGHREPLECIAQADTAVYHAKERGRGRVEVFDERLAQVLEERAEMALTMRHALAERQFSLKLQPIIDVATSMPVGAEVLLRWDRPGMTEIGPTDFIPIAERTGVIVDIETWVLEEAVGILRDWRLDPTTSRMRLAVNISGRHIVEGNLAPLLEELCSRASVDPTLLDLEITETHLVADIARAGNVVDDLRAQGVNVAIDDFGTGYSSMSYLHRLTVDTLKIDQVFVAGMCDNRLDLTIVELLLRLGDSLGMTVVAEGVDSEEKLVLLRELGCPWAQGFHIARPMSVGDATRWLRQQEALAASLR